MASFEKNRYFVLFAMTGMVLLSGVQYADAAPGDNVGSNSSVQNLDTKEFFSTIQEAVDAAGEGATIVVYPGTHVENVDVNKQLTIRSYSGSPLDTIVRASSSEDHVFYVSASNVKISGLTITGASQNEPCSGIYLARGRGCTIENNIFSGNWYGILLDNSASNILNNNIVSSNSDTGICLVGSVSNKLTGNKVSSNSNYGFWLKDSSNSNTLTGNSANSNTRSGFLLDNQCIGNTLSDNTAEANGEHGVYFNAASSTNSLKNNTIGSNSIYGIYLSSSGGNQVTGNNRIVNNGRGICLSNSNGNSIYNNYFSNTENTYFEGSNSRNSWNTTKTEQVNIVGGPYLGGNFWAKPDGSGPGQVDRDLTGDGFLDAEYALAGVSSNAAESNADYLPLARTVIVDPTGQKGYTRIQDAVNAVDNGYSVVVYPGNYRENLDLSKGVAIAAISGSPENTAVVAGDSNTHIFNIHSSGTVIRGFSITGAEGTDSSSGIFLDGVSECILSNNLVSRNSVGICLSNSGGNTLLDNRMSSNKYNFKDSGTLQNEINISNTVDGKPIYYLCGKSDMEIGPASNAGTVYCINCNNISLKNLVLNNNPRGVSFYNTGNSRILNNIIQGNFDGIYLESSSGNTLDGNTVNKSINSGIYLSGSASNTVVNNRITENEVSGIGLSSSGSNLIYNNYFNNANNVNPGADGSANTWNTAAAAGVNIVGAPAFGGNYWATPQGTGFSQTCTDVGDDYICRQAYTIGQNNIDFLPLFNPAPVLPLVDFSANFAAGLAPLPVNFTASSSSRAWPVQWSWDFGDGTSIRTGQNNMDGIYNGSVDHTYNSPGDFTVNLSVSNSYGTAYKTSRIFVAKPVVSSLSIGKYVASLDENTKEIVIDPVYGNVEVVDKAVLIRLEGIDLYIFSENGFETDGSGNLKGNYQYAKMDKTFESAELGNLTAGYSFSANLNGQLSALLSPGAGITCGVVPGIPSSSIEQAFKDSLGVSSLYMNRAAYSLIIEKNGLDGIDISDASLVLAAPADYVNTDGGSDKFTIMSWRSGGAEKLTTSTSTADSSFNFTGTSPSGFSSEGPFIASLISLTSTANNGSGDGSSSGGDSSGEDGGSGGSSSSGGGGGGSVSPEAKDNIEAKELSQQFVLNGTHAKFQFSKGVTCVGSVEFDAKKSVGKINTFVEMLKGKSTLVTSLPNGKVYGNLNIWVGSGGIITPETIENAFIEFKVDKAWVQNNSVDLSTVTLHRYSSTWDALPTTFLKEDGAYYYFKANTPGFSPFAITGSEKQPIQPVQSIPFKEVPKTVARAEQPVSEVPKIASNQKNESGNPSGNKGNSFILLVSALVVGLFLVGMLASPKVRNGVKDFLFGEINLSDLEIDEAGQSFETGNETTGPWSATVSKPEEHSEIDNIAEQQEASAKRDEFNDFISKLKKSKP